jgi:hypothetical protein
MVTIKNHSYFKVFNIYDILLLYVIFALLFKVIPRHVSFFFFFFFFFLKKKSLVLLPIF